MMVVVAAPDPRRRIDEARRVAELVLPRAVDLWGLSWDRDDDALDTEPGGGPPDECLPPAFPAAARLADADVTFVRARKGGLVHAMAVVFDDPLSAHQAWMMLGADEFVTCFAESVVAAVELDPHVELLGPVVVPAATDRAADPAPSPSPTEDETGTGTGTAAFVPSPVGRGGGGADPPKASRRTTALRITLAAATEDALLPIAIDIAVIVASSVVVMLWAVERPGPAKDRGWARLVERVQRKCDAVAAPG